MTGVLVILGPTATGKTRLAIELAKLFNGEIVSADSAQVYKNIKVGTAKPTKEELGKVKYHLIDFLDPADSIFFSVADYVKIAKQKILNIKKRKKSPILCGGTGLYIDSLINNIHFFENSKDIILKKKLESFCQKRGSDILYKELQKIDPESAKRIHKNNVSRIIRALEFYITSGLTLTKQVEISKGRKIFDPLYIGLNYRNRENLIKVINSRVDSMLANGLLEEAKENFEDGSGKILEKIIGYKELKDYIYGNSSFGEAVERIKIHTRQYAKRQMTWFKRNKLIEWFYVDEEGSFDNLLSHVKSYIKAESKSIRFSSI